MSWRPWILRPRTIAAAPANGLIQITPAPATVTLSNLSQVFDGTPKAATVTTVPAALAVTTTYDGSNTPPSAVGSYSVVATVTDPNYSGSGNGVLHILTSGAAANIAANSAITLSGAAGAIAAPLPSVKVTDCQGNPVEGYSVTFVTGSNSGTLSGATQATDASGIATVGGWTLGTTATETVSVTATGLTGSPVMFTASVTAQVDVAVNFTDNRDFVQYGRTLDYVIVVSNSGPSTAHSAVTDNLPPELDVASSNWVCFSHTTGATCTASGSGNLSDTPSIPPRWQRHLRPVGDRAQRPEPLHRHGGETRSAWTRPVTATPRTTPRARPRPWSSSATASSPAATVRSGPMACSCRPARSMTSQP